MWDELIYVVFFGVHLDTLFQTTCVDWVKICTLNNPKWKPTMIRQIVVVIDELVEFEGVATSVWKHQFQMRRLEMELPSWLSQGKSISASNVPHFKEFGSRLVLYFLVKIVHFQHRLKKKVLSLAKPPSWIEVERLYQIKEGPILKPSSSKLGTYVKVEIFLHWLTKLHFKTNISQKCVAFTWEVTGWNLRLHENHWSF